MKKKLCPLPKNNSQTPSLPTHRNHKLTETAAEGHPPARVEGGELRAGQIEHSTLALLAPRSCQGGDLLGCTYRRDTSHENLAYRIKRILQYFPFC